MVRVADELRYEDIKPEGIGKKILKGLFKIINKTAKLIINWQLAQYKKWDKEFEEEKKKGGNNS